MPWQQLKIHVSAEHLETLEELLLEQGALSVTYLDAEDQAIFQKEPGSTPLWDKIVLISLFEEDAFLDNIIHRLQQHPAVDARIKIEIEVLEDQQWERSWMTDFQAMQFGDKLWICPNWQTPPDADAINIMLDPGLAFGSGSHATTGMCLRWLAQNDVKNSTVIDYGCGSGVLAMAAALLGASKVYAVDNDPQAITSTEENIRRNGIDSGSIKVCLPDAFIESLAQAQADILVANILAEPLLQLASMFAEILKPGGRLILSGLLEDQAEQLLAEYGQWFAMQQPVLEDEWVRLTGTRLG